MVQIETTDNVLQLYCPPQPLLDLWLHVICWLPWNKISRKPLCSTEKLGDGYPEHILVENNYSFCGIRVARSLALCVCFVDRCLCVVCSSSIYGYWLLLGYLQTLLIDNCNNFQRIVLEDKHILERKVVFYIHRRWFICYDHCHDRMVFGWLYIYISVISAYYN